MQKVMLERAKALLSDGTVRAVLAWEKGNFAYDPTPAVFNSVEKLEKCFVYSPFCGANLSKYLIKETEKEGKILVFLKPCDTYSFNQLVSEHRIKRERVYAVGVECKGMLDIEKIRETGVTALSFASWEGEDVRLVTSDGETKVKAAELMHDRCLSCKSKKHVAYDELLGEEGEVIDSNRFDEVAKLEAMSAKERFEFWQAELSRCIRCNACRNVCPACSCEKCIFDNPDSGVENKAAADPFEEKLFHIIRAFHVAGRCTDCGECSRVCPEHIPLHLLNRKFIKDINELYGEFQAGETDAPREPLTEYKAEDVEPDVVNERGAE